MRVGVVTTGGTIAGTVMDGVVQAASKTDDEAAGLIAEATGEVSPLVKSPVAVMSENMDPSDWVAIAQAVRELVEREGADGVLVLHGTDTAAFTAAALSFMCADLRRPIVLTGANLPAAEGASDALNNVLGAVTALRNLSHGCYLSFSGAPTGRSDVFSGSRVRKVHAGGQPYRSVGAPIVAEVLDDGVWVPNPAAAALVGQPSLAEDIHVGVDHRVALMVLYPGFDFRSLKRLVDVGNYKAIVLQLYASISAPTRTGTLDCAAFVSWCRSRDVTVIGCPHEPPTIKLNDYESTVHLREAGMLIAPTMLPEVAYVKATWLGARSASPDEFDKLFLEPVAAEFFAAVATPF